LAGSFRVVRLEGLVVAIGHQGRNSGEGVEEPERTEVSRRYCTVGVFVWSRELTKEIVRTIEVTFI
jgi:hypothetical protein